MCPRHWSRSLPSDAEDQSGRHEAEQAGGHERELVVAEVSPHRAGRESDRSSAELMRREDPPVHDRKVLLSENPACDLHGRRHGLDPVQSVKDDEKDEAELWAPEGG